MASKEDLYVTTLMRQASDLAQTGCKLDEEGKLGNAMKHYDEAIMTMDCILSQIPPSAEAWKVLLDLRSQYSNRLVSLDFRIFGCFLAKGERPYQQIARMRQLQRVGYGTKFLSFVDIDPLSSILRLFSTINRKKFDTWK